MCKNLDSKIENKKAQINSITRNAEMTLKNIIEGVDVENK